MKRLLDTNICIYVLRGHPLVLGSLRAHSPASLRLSAVTLAELWFGARKSRSPERMRALQDAFTAPFEVLPFDNARTRGMNTMLLTINAPIIPSRRISSSSV